jgi:deazaflavin-dependent oxidoreductase (nitroreductase family)
MIQVKEIEMDAHQENPMPRTEEHLLVELRRLEWAKGLSEESLAAIMQAAEYVECHAGEVIIEVESEIAHVWFLVTGRLHATLYDPLGKELQKDTFVRGSVIGLFSLGLSDRSHIRVQATELSTAIRLTSSDLLQLTAKHADFQLAMFRVAANIFKRYVTFDRSLPKPPVVGIVHQTEASRPIGRRLARRLRELDESPCIAADDEQWRPDEDIPFRLLVREGRIQEQTSVLKDWASHRRLLIDVSADHPQTAMLRLFSYVDIVLWCVRPQDATAAIPLLQELEKNVPKWRDKIRIVWLLDNNAPVAPYVPELHRLADRDFKLTLDAPGPNQVSLLQHGIERVIHHLRGVQIGLALGGGAARGMAHLGVLKALEQHGIYIDMLAGTSAGAMTGTIYAAGLDPERFTQIFKRDLQPTWFFRRLPGGGYWYLFYKYRRHHFDFMLRKYLGRARMEQLVLPMLEVQGRRSGRRRSVPVVIATVEGKHYLVSMLGPESAWVKNVKAANGNGIIRQGRRTRVHLSPIPPADRGRIIQEYVRIASSGRRHFPLPSGAPLADFNAIADRYPVYRIDPV